MPRTLLLRAEAEKEPLLKRLIDVLGAQVVRIDEGFGVAPEPADTAEPEEV
jgi:hypothetical protein